MIVKAEEYRKILEKVREENLVQKHKYALDVISCGIRKSISDEKHIVKFNMDRISSNLWKTHYEFSKSRREAVTLEQKNLFSLLDYLSRQGYFYEFLRESKEIIVGIHKVFAIDGDTAVEI